MHRRRRAQMITKPRAMMAYTPPIARPFTIVLMRVAKKLAPSAA